MKYNASITLIMNLIKTLTSWEIEDVAKNIGFSIRRRGLTATTFFQVFTVGIWELHDITLDLIASKCCELQYGLKTLTKQALFKRLKVGAILLKEMLNKAMAYAATYSVATERVMVLKQFKNVYICDSTSISLSDKLESIWPGLGGTNAAAATKIQVMFSIIERRFKKIELFAATSNDSKYTQNIVQILQSMELVVFDLGFYCIRAFKDIMDKGAFFISRIKANSILYTPSARIAGKFEKVDLAEILRKSNGVVDKRLYIGGSSKNRIEVRLVAIRLPEDVVNERRRKAHKKAKSIGRTVSKHENEMLAWNVMITNTPEDMLSAETICEIYRIRWQIENIFKSWKGCFEIDEVGEAGKEYLECLLYGKLIVITLMTTLYSQAYYWAFRMYRRGISLIRFFKLLREKMLVIQKNLICNVRNTEEILGILQDVINRSLEEKRQRKTTEQELAEHDLPLMVLQMLV